MISYGTCSSGMTFEKFCQKNLQTLLKFQKSHPATKCSIQNHYRADFGDTLQDKYSQTSILSADFGDTLQDKYSQTSILSADFGDTLQDKFNKQDKYSQTSIPSADFGDTSQENTCLDFTDFKDTLQDKYSTSIPSRLQTLNYFWFLNVFENPMKNLEKSVL